MYGWPCKRSKSKPYYLTIKQLFLAVDWREGRHIDFA
jgi:hypothetical protein